MIGHQIYDAVHGDANDAGFQNDGPDNQAAAEPMQVDLAPEDQLEIIAPEPEHQVENATLDLEVYAGQYKGLSKLYRLVYVADHCASLRMDALRMAIFHVMSTYNTGMYQRIHKKLQEAAASQGLPDAVSISVVPPFDTQWIEVTNKKAALKLEKLDTDLKNYKCNSIKESIRRGHDDLGDHYMDCGDLSNALKCYSRSRDYCTSAKHIINMCINVIKVSLYLQNWSHVLSYVNKAEATPNTTEVSVKEVQQTNTMLKNSAGLAELALKKYKSAAKYFLQANIDYCDEILSPNNVAIYGGLCALATFDRSELQRLVINSVSFKQFLELEPILRDILHFFNASKYAACLQLLNQMKDNLLLDMYLAPHITTLYAQIRQRGMCQFFSPYLSADLHKMAEAFNTPLPALEDEIMHLILDGQINARIDSHKKILRAKDSDQRSQTYEKALALGTDYHRRAKALVIRSAIVRNNLCVKGSSREDGNMGGGGGEMSITPGART